MVLIYAFAIVLTIIFAIDISKNNANKYIDAKALYILEQEQKRAEKERQDKIKDLEKKMGDKDEI